MDICFLQETKLHSFSISTEEELRGAKDVEWSHCDSTGALGGVATIWRRKFLKHVCSFKGEGFIVIKSIWNN